MAPLQVDDVLDIGRLEINIDGPWLAICADDFTEVEAQVACQQLGFMDGSLLLHFALSVELNFTCPASEDDVDHVLFEGPLTWTDAEAHCASQGGHLASFPTPSAFECVADQLGTEYWGADPNKWCIFIGASAVWLYDEQKCGWKWSDGSNFSSEVEDFFVGGPSSCYGDISYAHILTTPLPPLDTEDPIEANSSQWGVLSSYDDQPDSDVHCSYLCQLPNAKQLTMRRAPPGKAILGKDTLPDPLDTECEESGDDVVEPKAIKPKKKRRNKKGKKEGQKKGMKKRRGLIS
eukprot:gene10002-7886_t